MKKFISIKPESHFTSNVTAFITIIYEENGKQHGIKETLEQKVERLEKELQEKKKEIVFIQPILPYYCPKYPKYNPFFYTPPYYTWISCNSTTIE
jgi:hypothetical protein